MFRLKYPFVKVDSKEAKKPLDKYYITEIYLHERCCCQNILHKYNIGFCVYYYKNEGYEGYGIAFLKHKYFNLWFYHDLGHCSCYNAFDYFKASISFKSLETLKEYAIKNDWSEEYSEIIKTIYQICKEQLC